MQGTRRLRGERGQATVEFAVVLPLLAILLFGIIQSGITLEHYLSLTDAVRAGARTASVSAGLGATAATSAATSAMTDAADGLDLQDPQVQSTWQSGAPVTVSAQVPYSITILGVTVASGNLTSTTTQRVE
jgi:Flp pilus assembly protein TadG